MRSLFVTALALSAALACAWAAAAPPAQRWAQLADTVFQSYGLESGLPSPAVLALAVDGDGQLWAGTEDGLVRWDGYRFRAYRSDPGNPRALPDNSVFNLHTDAKGRLWAGTSAGGLVRYDREQDSFSALGTDRGLSSMAVLAVADDGRGGLWVGTSKGLDHLGSDGATLTREAIPAALTGGSAEPLAVNALLLDRKGNLWLGTSQGLLRRSAQAGQFTVVPLAVARARAPEVFALMEDSAGRIWVGTRNDGAFYFLPASELPPVQLQARDGAGADLSVEWVHALAEARPGQVWVGTDGNGILAVDMATGQTRWIRHAATRATSLAHNTVQALLRDRSGLLWVGGVGGLGRTDPGQGAILSVFGDSGRPQGLSNKDVHAVHTTADGHVWLGLVANGVDVIDPAGQRVAELRPDPARPQSALPGARVVAITSTAGGDVYLGTSRGLYRTDLAARHVSRVNVSTEHPDMPVYGLHIVGSTLWVASITDGLWRVDLKGNGNGQRVAKGQLTDERVWSFANAPNGQLWVGTYNGLNLLDPASGKVEKIEPDPRDPEALSPGLIPSLLYDRQGRLWVGTVNGSVDVLEGRDASGRFRFRRLATGKPLKGAPNQWLLDAQGRMWTSTDDGIAVFDTDKLTVRVLQRADGVAIRSYWASAGDKTAAGELLFGGLGGLTVVRPELLQDWHYAAPLVVTDVRLGGKPVPPGGFNGAAGGDAARLLVQPEGNSLAVEFAALDYSEPQYNRYAYKLDGFDADWVETDWTRRVASYTNLAPGDYVLRLRGSNRNGQWSDKPLALPLRVLPAWYQTWWFRVLAALAVVLAAVLLVRWRTGYLRRRQAWLEQQVAQRTEELVAAHRELERIAYIDTLTLLPNRRMFNDAFHQQLALARRQGRQFAFALIDLDRFKEINDTRGHDVGDALLVAAARRLQAAVRESDIVARIGGDEFAILLTEVDDPQRVEGVCRRIVESFTEPVQYKHQRVGTSPSIGLSLFPKDGDSQESLFKAADLALYAAKREGRNTWRWYSAEQEPQGPVSTLHGPV